MNRSQISAGIALVAVAVLAIAGCGGPAATAAPTSVVVTLLEWAVATNVQTARAGQVNFSIYNQGPDDVHEFVVLKTDLSLIALPTDGTGAVDETLGGLTSVGEVEDIAYGTTKSLSVTLTPGAYVLICNIYTAAENESHYQKGMRTSFTVTQ